LKPSRPTNGAKRFLATIEQLKPKPGSLRRR
jgi:hypothetical protein